MQFVDTFYYIWKNIENKQNYIICGGYISYRLREVGLVRLEYFCVFVLQL